MLSYEDFHGHPPIGWAKQAGYVYLETDVDFQPGFEKDGKMYCEGRLFDMGSNLDLWQISLNGKDDLSLLFNIIGEKEAKEYWEGLKKAPLLTEEILDGFIPE